MVGLVGILVACTEGAAPKAAPVREPPPVIDAAIGGDTVCVVVAEPGNAFCWGRDSAEYELPTESMESVDGGDYGFCGRTVDGELRCWGDAPDGGELPTWAVSDYSVGIAICELDPFGYASCRGSDYWDFGVREDVPPDRPFSRIAAAVRGACTLTIEGEIECYVRDDSELLPPPAGTFVELTLGDDQGCALAADGRMECWPIHSEHPDEAFAVVSAGFGYECGVTLSQELQCWPQWDSNTIPEEDSRWYTPHLVTSSAPQDGKFLTVDAGVGDAVAVTTDGGVEVFGTWEFGTYAEAWFAAHPE